MPAYRRESYILFWRFLTYPKPIYWLSNQTRVYWGLYLQEKCENIFARKKLVFTVQPNRRTVFRHQFNLHLHHSVIPSIGKLSQRDISDRKLSQRHTFNWKIEKLQLQYLICQKNFSKRPIKIPFSALKNHPLHPHPS